MKWQGILAGAMSVLTLEFGLAQGTLGDPEVLVTGGGQPLVTGTRLFPAAVVVSNSVLQFDFGFSTDEVPAPSQVLDSFSVTLQDGPAASTAILLTADGSGVVWLPSSPGTLTVPVSSLRFQSIVYPTLTPTFQNRAAFAVSLDLPQAFWGRDLNVYFDLFDNQNPAASSGWFNQVVIVPEPHGTALLLTGLGLLAWARRRLNTERDD